MVKSRHLKIIITALQRNLLILLFMVESNITLHFAHSTQIILTIEVIYVFSIFSLLYFQDKYNAENGSYCTTLLQCWISNLFHGFPSDGGIFEFLEPFTWNSPRRWGWIAWSVLFYFIIGVIILNVILASIVDTFGQLREKRKQAKNELNSSCFICSIDRDQFQQNGKGEFLSSLHRSSHCLGFFSRFYSTYRGTA